MIRSYSNYSQGYPPVLTSISPVPQERIPFEHIPFEDVLAQGFIEPSPHFLEEKFIPEISNIIISFLNFKDFSALAQVSAGSNNLISSQQIYSEGKANLKTDKFIRFFKNFTI